MSETPETTVSTTAVALTIEHLVDELAAVRAELEQAKEYQAGAEEVARMAIDKCAEAQAEAERLRASHQQLREALPQLVTLAQLRERQWMSGDTPRGYLDPDVIITEFLSTLPATTEGEGNKITPTHRHYKGGYYRFLMDASDERDGTPLVVYQSCETGRVWVRLAHEFRTGVRSGDGWVPRFAAVDATTPATGTQESEANDE